MHFNAFFHDNRLNFVKNFTTLRNLVIYKILKPKAIKIIKISQMKLLFKCELTNQVLYTGR